MKKCSKIIYVLFFILFMYACHSEQKIIKKDGMIFIHGGTFEMGGDNYQAREDEYPKHTVNINAFWIDETEVTNAQFAAFVKATNYITTAEKDFNYIDNNGNTQHQNAGSLVFFRLEKDEIANPNTWWKFIEGANWKHPEGKYSTIIGKEHYPVVHISWYDANAYAKWCNKRLPTEAEWEYAARGKLKNKPYTWGNNNTAHIDCNSWNGDFPYKNTQLDKFENTAPVKSYMPNTFGIYDMAGNVWEWCLDTYQKDFYAFCKKNKIVQNPISKTNTVDSILSIQKVVRGGSFLCNDNYCSGFRVSARMFSTAETSLSHTGFRCVKDVNR